MSQLTREERLDILQRSHQAIVAGNQEEALRISLKLPLAPHLAKVAKEIWGKDFLLNSGFDLSEAEAQYGKKWIDN